MKNDKMEKTSDIAKDIIHMEIESEIIDKLNEKFYEIARKHGLKWGTKEGNGVSGANFEWTMAKDFFLYTMVSQMQFKMLFDYPDDLAHYEEEEIT